ncbi:DUF6895 family protein [Streptomyces oceani]|uniref:DUF6895 family protein n=1 Tax=Streptomyces oceani TaxID=1075402 RepID=UPI000872C442|nr:hypothetical protein [Streptomyces oceani]
MNLAGWEHVSRAALSWLHGRLPRFRPPPGVADPVDTPGESRDLLLKPLGELAQLCVCVLRAAPAGSVQRRLAREMLDFAWRETGRGELFRTLARDEPHAVHPVETYGPFAEAGLRHREFEEYARFLVTTRAWSLAEEPPTRALALLNARRRLGVSYALGGARTADPRATTDEAFAEATRRTWLGGLAEPWTFEARVGYALTHHVFHLTNWGALPEQLPPEVRDHLALWLPAWLDCCVAGRHWDLTGELLAVAAILPPPHAGAVPIAEAWEAYAAAQDADGAYAELGTPPSAETGQSDHDEERVFRACYHATVVAALAAVLAAARHRTSAATAMTGATVRPHADADAASPVPLSLPTTGGDRS